MARDGDEKKMETLAEDDVFPAFLGLTPCPEEDWWLGRKCELSTDHCTRNPTSKL
jgi:hypothetical protein